MIALSGLGLATNAAMAASGNWILIVSVASPMHIGKVMVHARACRAGVTLRLTAPTTTENATSYAWHLQDVLRVLFGANPA